MFHISFRKIPTTSFNITSKNSSTEFIPSYTNLYHFLLRYIKQLNNHKKSLIHLLSIFNPKTLCRTIEEVYWFCFHCFSNRCNYIDVKGKKVIFSLMGFHFFCSSHMKYNDPILIKCIISIHIQYIGFA